MREREREGGCKTKVREREREGGCKTKVRERGREREREGERGREREREGRVCVYGTLNRSKVLSCLAFHVCVCELSLTL